MRGYFVCAVALAAVGCASTATEQTRRQVQTALAQAAAKGDDVAVEATGHPAPASTASCEALAGRVAASHPRVMAGHARARASLSRSRSAGALPPPRASLEVWDFPIGAPGRAEREGMYMLGVAQELPAAGARDGRARAEVLEAEMALADAAVARREVWGEVMAACVDWSAAEAVRVGLLGHRQLLVDMREAVLSGYRGGADSLGMVARAEAEISAADRHVVEAEEELRVARETLVALVAGAAQVAELPPALEVPSDVGADAELVQRAEAQRSELLGADAKQASARARIEAADAEATMPMLEVSATYMQTPAMRAGLGAMVSMSLPWLWGGYDSVKQGAEQDGAAAAAERADVERTIRVQVTRAAGQLRALSRSHQILLSREIPAAARALDAERAALLTGSFSLSAWISASHALRQAHIDEARTRGALARARLELLLATGEPEALVTRRTQP